MTRFRSGSRAHVAALAAAGTAAVVAVGLTTPAVAQGDRPIKRPKPVAGANGGQTGIKTFASQVAEARKAPYGSVPPGEYSRALASLRGLPGTGGPWAEVTDKPYDSNDPNYRDPLYSNSGAGWGNVAGRITGLAVGNGFVFGAGANGGVFRQPAGGRTWTPISEGILSLSSGDLFYDKAADVLWYATGEANTGATTYTGAGVYRLRNASRATGFRDADRVGGGELESRSINQIKVDGAGSIYAATSRGLYRHATAESAHTARWTRVLLPNPASDTDVETPYDNIVNDVTFQPGTGGRVVMANAAWRNGADYNGFYVSTAYGAAGTFRKVAVSGDIDNADIGNGEFATAADGSRTYLVLESPAGLLAGTTALSGVYVARTLTGPWTRIATSAKLMASGSALTTPDYPVGIQAWYNNFVEVDPGNPEHVYVGLEEVFETTNGGRSWTTPGPYWNFGFGCFDPTVPSGGCPSTTHPDQHSIGIDRGRVFIGNDGGVYSRPLAPARSTENRAGHATDWRNHNAGLRTLQYYSVGVGKDPERPGYAVSGGLQDNGASLIRGGARKMVSPFGGDGGDIIVNPRNGCQILDEYVFLALWLTKNCGQSDGTTSAVFDITVPEVNARFTAPFRVVRGSKNVGSGASERWAAGGNSVWVHNYGFSYTRAQAAAEGNNGWYRQYATDATGARLVVGLDVVANPAEPKNPKKDTYYAAWCGESNCNSTGFTRGVATNWGGAWTELDMTGLPNRFPSNVLIDPDDATNSTVFVVFNGFNRRFVEGPGAGTKHVFRGKLSKSASGTVSVAWTDLSKGFPDVPATDLVIVGDRLVVGTDLGVLVANDKDATGAGVRWQRVGPNSGAAGGLPLTAVFDLHIAPDGGLYAATHGRGIWRIPLSRL